MFGEIVAGYEVPVLNEREVRAGAGILFFIATVVFLGAWHADLLLPAQMMIIAFFIEFVIRVFVPRYAPSLILGRLIVGHQKPEYTAAAPKRFAWTLGLILASIMLVTMIFMRDMSMLNFAICGVCILLLFMESSFGICLGCLIYDRVLKKRVGLCPGDVCEVRQKEPIQRVSGAQLSFLGLFVLAMFAVFHLLDSQERAHAGPNHRVIQMLKGDTEVRETGQQTLMKGHEHRH
ncbi:MAG: DUF4395 domain-containing protein [Rhodocyclaceae bacterium]|nr:DUF4395 domain-containing protein [Rhodocyclaceae bacterium]